MAWLQVLTAAEQVAGHLRKELQRGTWRGSMPGAARLAAEFGIGHNTIEAALHQLEEEGVLVPQGPGRRRRIVLPEDPAPPGLRMGILLCQDQADRHLEYMLKLQHDLAEAGHLPFHAGRTQFDLGMDVEQIADFVRRSEADVWVVCSGSREVLEWFAMQSVPTMSLFGHGQGLPIARVGPNKVPAFVAATRRLVGLGHRHIVMLARQQRLLPKPGPPEQAFLDELAAHGLPTGTYNLPSWEESKEGFHQLIDELFRVTPPTALIVEEQLLFLAAQQHLAQRGILAPEDVSLVCTDPEDCFDWCEPSVSHIHWDCNPVVRRVVCWANNVARGRNDRRQTLTKAEFVEGGTIGPARRQSPF